MVVNCNQDNCDYYCQENIKQLVKKLVIMPVKGRKESNCNYIYMIYKREWKKKVRLYLISEFTITGIKLEGNWQSNNNQQQLT